MGNTGSRAAGYEYAQVQRPSWLKQQRCRRIPTYADVRGWMLTQVYGVPDGGLDKYPPSVYSLDMAEADLKACQAGRTLPHHKKVVVVEKVVGRGKDPREYTLTRYHGFTRRELRTALERLPYSKKNAQIDIASYQKTGRPYYFVDRVSFTVRDRKYGTVRNWRHKGFEDKYRYDRYDPQATGQRLESLRSARVRHRIDVGKYKRRRTRSGQWVVDVPCSDAPYMCAPGEKTFTYDASGYGSATDKAAKALADRTAKLDKRRRQVEHSRQMERLAKRIKALNRSKPENQEAYRRLTQQRANLQKAFRQRT